VDHVIEDLKKWISVYEEVKDSEAIECIEKAIGELQKYYD